MRKLAFCISENKDADQLRGNREADQRLCFRYTDNSIMPLLPSSVTVQPSLCLAWSETLKTVFSQRGSNYLFSPELHHEKPYFSPMQPFNIFVIFISRRDLPFDCSSSCSLLFYYFFLLCAVCSVPGYVVHCLYIV